MARARRGPSGSGKDTLLRAARLQLGMDVDSRIVFTRRFITREADPHENHYPLTTREFLELERRGDFALCWRAHGLCYGLPVSVISDLKAGVSVVCNASRTVIGEARKRFANVKVIEVTAPAELRKARLAERNREAEDDRSRRLFRHVDAPDAFDITIENAGSVTEGAAALVAAIRQCGLAGSRVEET